MLHGASLVALALLGRAAGQFTSAVCTSGYEWMFNTLQQSPCVVGSYLQGACIASVFNISALPADQHYVGPQDPALSTPCACSTVTYALVSGCAACQGADTDDQQKWSNWIANCNATDITVGSFPHRFSNRTRIPAWAFVDVVPADTFELEPAYVIANASRPDVGPDGPITSGAGKKGGANIGAIVGGVIGGLAVLGIIAAVTVFFCLRHRRKLNRPAYTPAMTQQHGFLGAPEQQTYSQATPYSLSSSGPVTPNLYDPYPARASATFSTTPTATDGSQTLPSHSLSGTPGPPQYSSPPPQQSYSPPPPSALHPYGPPPVQSYAPQKQQHGAYTGIAEL